MPLGVQSLELLGSLVQLNLGSLGLSYLSLKLVGLPCDFDSEFFDLEGELLDLCLVGPPILLEGKVVLLLLPGSQRPLL